MRSVTVILLASISLAFCACFQEDQARPETARLSSRITLSRANPGLASQTSVSSPAANGPSGSVTEYYFSIPESISEQELNLPTLLASGNAARHDLEADGQKGVPLNKIGAAGRATRARLFGSRQENPEISLNASFRSLFASVFSRREGDSLPEALYPQTAGEEILNPFTEAKRQIEAEKVQAAAAGAAAQPEKQNPASSTPSAGEKASQSARQQSNAMDGVQGGISRREPRYIFLGDFDGTGTLKPAAAERIGETKFAFKDASRTFVVFCNSSAVENERSVAVEDMDGDGNMDLLVTSRAGLFGAVVLSDDVGNFRVSDTFLTGYEPTVAIPGPMTADGREILSVNVRTGKLNAFRPRGRYLRYAEGNLHFVPDFLAHLVNLETGLDCLLAGQIGSAPSVYDWPGNTQLALAAANLPSEPTIAIGSEAAGQSGIGSLQVYQIGPFASVVMSNSQGQAFNVANLRVTPKVFLLFGDIEKRGTLDVGVAILLAANQ